MVRVCTYLPQEEVTESDFGKGEGQEILYCYVHYRDPVHIPARWSGCAGRLEWQRKSSKWKTLATTHLESTSKNMNSEIRQGSIITWRAQ